MKTSNICSTVEPDDHGGTDIVIIPRRAYTPADTVMVDGVSYVATREMSAGSCKGCHFAVGDTRQCTAPGHLSHNCVYRSIIWKALQASPDNSKHTMSFPKMVITKDMAIVEIDHKLQQAFDIDIHVDAYSRIDDGAYIVKLKYRDPIHTWMYFVFKLTSIPIKLIYTPWGIMTAE